jgi:hypothetical protein
VRLRVEVSYVEGPATLEQKLVPGDELSGLDCLEPCQPPSPANTRKCVSSPLS